MDSNIFVNPKDKNVKKVPSSATEQNFESGFLVKRGTLDNLMSNILTITTQNVSNKENYIYAIIIEFWEEN